MTPILRVVYRSFYRSFAIHHACRCLCGTTARHCGRPTPNTRPACIRCVAGVHRKPGERRNEPPKHQGTLRTVRL